jgi:hypothetical protein
MTMHVLISVTAALLMQMPGVHLSAIDAATVIERATASPGRDASSASRTLHGRTCLCPAHRRAN